MISIRALIVLSCLAVGGPLLPGVSYAQVSIDSQNEMTTADAAEKLLRPVDEEGNTELAEQLEGNGVEAEAEAEAAMEALAGSVDAYAPESGPLTLMNCSGDSIKVKTYNSTDTVLWVPYMEKTIADGSSSGLKCATSSCKLKVGSAGASPAVSGYRVYKDGLKDTNQKAMAMGCDVY